MKEKILLVVNPISGNSGKEQIIELVKDSVEMGNLEIYKTSGEKDESKIRDLCKAKNIHRILVAGGDGTIKLIAEATRKLNLVLGIIPAGSSNGFATDLGLPINMKDAIEVALGKTTKKVDVLCIEDQICLHICDFGLNAELIQEYDGSILRGKVGYALNSIPTLIKSEIPFQFKIELNGESLEKEAIMIAVANCKKFGTGAVVNPNSKMDDGIFEVLVFKKLDVLEIFKTLVEGAELDSEFLEIIPAKKVKISTVKPIPFQIDGEVCDKRDSVIVEIMEQYIQVAVNTDSP